MNDKQILLLGDTHGVTGWTVRAIRAADHLGITHILQLGDFGFWPHVPSGKEFLNEVKQQLVKYGIELWWVDGNHENHDWLSDEPHDDSGFWRDGNLVHIGRGARWTWGGRTFLGCGGAYSIDVAYRREGTSWWAGETISEADVLKCGGPPVDVLVTHDAPWGAPHVIGPGTSGFKDDYPQSAANRKRVAAICDMVTPKLLVHGHYHHRNSTMYRGTQVEGFNRDGYLASLGVLSLGDLTVTDIP